MPELSFEHFFEFNFSAYMSKSYKEESNVILICTFKSGFIYV